MNKKEFLLILKDRLIVLKNDDVDKIINYYDEIIDDMIDDNIKEKEAVASLGSVDSIINKIYSEYPLTQKIKERLKRNSTWVNLILIVLGAPLWIPLVGAFVTIVLTIYAVIWVLIVSLFAVTISLFASGLWNMFASPFLLEVSSSRIAFLIGTGISSFGLSVLLFYSSLYSAKWAIKLSVLVWNKLSSYFKGKGVDKYVKA